MLTKTLFIFILWGILSISLINDSNATTTSDNDDDDNSASDCNQYQTFTSPEYRFEMEYPSVLNVQNGLSTDSPPNVFFITFDSDCDAGSTSLLIYPNDQTLQQFVDAEMSDTEGTGEKSLLMSTTPITIDDSPALEFSYTTTGGIVMTKNIVFIHGENIYYLWFKDLTDSFNNDQYEHVRDSISFLD